jgi:hypothetical protein
VTRLGLLLRDVGSPAIITRVDIVVKHVRVYKTTVSYFDIKPSRPVAATLCILPSRATYCINVAKRADPANPERFFIELTHNATGTKSIFVYLADIEIFYNGQSTPVSSGDRLFAVAPNRTLVRFLGENPTNKYYNENREISSIMARLPIPKSAMVEQLIAKYHVETEKSDAGINIDDTPGVVPSAKYAYDQTAPDCPTSLSQTPSQPFIVWIHDEEAVTSEESPAGAILSAPFSRPQEQPH